MQKPDALLYTNNEISEREIKERVPFTIIKKIKYLDINLPKEVKDLYSENYKTLTREACLLTRWDGRGLGTEARASVESQGED